jgi:hypothetical protein
MSETTALKVSQLNNMNRSAQNAKLGSVLYSAAGGNYPGADYPNKVYYVNNVSGSATGDGQSWGTAMSQISLAITAWETYRTTVANLAAGNAYVRGIIYVQGTSTAYTALTVLPNYCDIVGLGADPRGNGSGIPSITAATGVDTVASTGVRGLNVFNMQFTGSGTGWSMNLAVCFRSTFINCAFVNKSTGSLQIVTGGGITIRNCQFGGDTVTPAIGLNVGTSAGNFNQCLIESNAIYASATGISNGAYLADGTVFRGNTVYGGTTGISDTSTNTGMAANAFYTGNFVSGGTNAIVATNNHAARCIGNSTVANTTGGRDAASS